MNRKLLRICVISVISVLVITGVSVSQYQVSSLNYKVNKLDQENATLQSQNSELEKQLNGAQQQLKQEQNKNKKLLQQESELNKQLKQQLSKNSATPLTSRGGIGVLPSSSSVSSWMTFEATFYNTGRIAADGKPVQDGVTIAVDPNVIPLGSIVEVKFPDGHIEYRRADDTGSAIRGRKIDVYKAVSTSALLKFGVQRVQVRVISRPK